MSTPAGDDLVGNATIRVDGDTDPAMRALRQFSRDAQGRIRDVRGRFVSESALITRSLTTAAGGGDRFGLSLRSIAGAARTAAGILGRVGLGIGAIGAAAGTAAPLLAGIVTTLQNIAPAGAVAVTGMLAITQATAAIRLGMVGMEDAVTAAFDSSEAGAKKFDEALKKLSPNAAEFALQVRELQPAFQKFQQGIQNRLFAGLADELQRLASTVLPAVRTNLNSTAVALNQMALGASRAARELATSGTLGKAMAGANQGLANLQKIPGQVVTALGQLAVAGAPAFDRLTEAAARAATGISERLGNAFESGALEDAVNTAVDLLRDLGTVGGNVFATLGNIMAPVQQAGGGLIGVLVQITGALREATASQGFQEAMGAIASVMSTLASTVGPLLGQALAALGPVFTALGPPLEVLITALGDALGPVITALGPVLTAAATAVGALVRAVSPLLPVIGQLVASLLPAVTPLFDALTTVFVALQPVISRIATILQQTLAPVMAGLAAIIGPLANLIATHLALGIGVLGDLLIELQPSLVSIGTSLGQLLVALGPVIAALGEVSARILAAVLPALTPMIKLVGLAAAVFAKQFATAVSLAIPLLIRLAAFVKTAADRMQPLADASRETVSLVIDAFQFLHDTLVGNSIIPDLINAAVRLFASLPGRAFNALSALAGRIGGRARSAGAALVRAIRGKLEDAVDRIKDLPGDAKDALRGLGDDLASSGRALIQGFIDGIKDKARAVASAVGDVVSRARDLLPGSPAKEGPFSGQGWTLFSGRAISESLAEGIAQREGLVRRAAAMLAASTQSAVSVPVLPMLDGAGAGLGVGAMRTGHGTPTVVNNYFTINVPNHGVIGSRREVEDFFVRTMDQLRVQRRLPGVT